MAASFNQCTFSGNVCADARVRRVGESDVADFTLAVNGRKDDQTTFVQVSYWRPGKVSEYLTKGKKVLVSGEAKLSTWTSKTGEMKSAIGLDARNLVLLGGGRKEEEPF